MSARTGTAERPGREFHMTSMAAAILQREDLDVLVYGIGRSRDNRHIETLPQVRQVAIGDIMKVRDDAEFVDITQPARRRFSVVVASEVVEHFRSPREDFAQLLSFVRRDGLVVCGTSIYAGGDLAADRYLFYSDHTSYYTPASLLTLSHRSGFHIDFRTPQVNSAMRKRYVLFSRSRDVMDRAACYFGTHVYAPSEEREPKPKPKPKAKRRA